MMRLWMLCLDDQRVIGWRQPLTGDHLAVNHDEL
jgi:hypothetical protein